MPNPQISGQQRAGRGLCVYIVAKPRQLMAGSGGFQTGRFWCYILQMKTSSHPLVTVRKALAADYDELSLVWHESASNMASAAPNMPSLNELRERIERELAAGWQLYLAECDCSIIGMLALKPTEAILDQIFVLTNAQGRGVGLKLLETAKSSMPNGFSLRMAADNRKAARFYKSAGLSVIGEGNHPVSGLPVQYYGWNAS